MESKLEGFAKIKWEVGLIQFDNLSMNSDKTAIEANPATHRIAEYIEANYVLKEKAQAREKVLVEALEKILKQDTYYDVIEIASKALAPYRGEKEVGNG
jgi:hypothetical protein